MAKASRATAPHELGAFRSSVSPCHVAMSAARILFTSWCCFTRLLPLQMRSRRFLDPRRLGGEHKARYQVRLCADWIEWSCDGAARVATGNSAGRRGEAHLKSPATALIWNMLPQPPLISCTHTAAMWGSGGGIRYTPWSRHAAEGSETNAPGTCCPQTGTTDWSAHWRLR